MWVLAVAPSSPGTPATPDGNGGHDAHSLKNEMEQSFRRTNLQQILDTIDCRFHLIRHDRDNSSCGRLDAQLEATTNARRANRPGSDDR